MPINRDKSFEGDKMEVAEEEIEIIRGVDEEDSDGQELKTGDDACIPVPVVPGNHDGDDRDNHEDDFGCIPSDSNRFTSDSPGDAGIVTKTLNVKKGKKNFRQRRLAMNRVSAKLRRDRKRNHLSELEENVQALMEANEILLNKSNELKRKITEVKYKIAAHEHNDPAAGAIRTTSSEVGNESQQIASGLGEMPEERPYMVAAGLTLAQNPAALAIPTRSALPSFPISSDHEGFRTTTMQAHPGNIRGDFTLIANNALIVTPESMYPAGAQLGIDFMANPAMANHMINPMTLTQFPPISQQYAGIDIGQRIHQPSVGVSSASSMFQGLNGEAFVAAPVLPTMVSAGGVVIHPQIGQQTFMAAPAASAYQMMPMGGIAPAYTGPGLASNDRNHDPRGEPSIFQEQEYINQAGKDSAHRSRQSSLISSPKEEQQTKDGK